MKITHLELHSVAASHRGNWIFVQIHTDAGLSGLGEASQSGNDGLVAAALEQLGPRLVGCGPKPSGSVMGTDGAGIGDFFG